MALGHTGDAASTEFECVFHALGLAGKEISDLSFEHATITAMPETSQRATLYWSVSLHASKASTGPAVFAAVVACGI